MPDVHVLRVFVGSDGSHGNLLAAFLDGAAVPVAERQSTAAAIGFSETVFVEDRARATVRIFTPAVELAFAGHPLVGTAWLLAREGAPPDELRPPAGRVPAGAPDGDRAWVAGKPEWAPPFEWVQLESPADVEALTSAPQGHDLIGAYAWEDEQTVRARVFPARLGIAEDEATGAAAIRLAARLGRAVTIRQGRGSVIDVRTRDDGLVEISGLVVLEGVRSYPSCFSRPTG